MFRYLRTYSGINLYSAVLVVSKETLVHALIRGAKAWDNKFSLDFLSSLCGCVGRNHHSILTPLQTGHGRPTCSTLQCNLVMNLCYHDEGGWCSGNNRSNQYKQQSFNLCSFLVSQLCMYSVQQLRRNVNVQMLHNRLDAEILGSST